MTKPVDQIDSSRLSKLYSENGPARAILDHFASRERNLSQTTVGRIQQNVNAAGKDISRGDVIAVFRELEACGCGEFKAGRRGWPSRFEWEVQMIGVGRFAAGEAEEIEKVSEEDRYGEEGEEEFLTHTFRLRPGTVLSFELPKDLSMNEASRLADFIRTLPFERSLQ